MKKVSYSFLFLVFLMAGCETNPSSALARQCNDGLKQANKELNVSKVKGFSGSVHHTKAAGLLVAASVQYEFGKYPNCIDKVKRARRMIKLSHFDKDKK
jgi:hypothetical protein